MKKTTAKTSKSNFKKLLSKVFNKEVFCERMVAVAALSLFVASCGENYHLTTGLASTAPVGPVAVISGSNPASPIGVNNAKVGIIGQFGDNGHDYDDDGSSPATREKEWIIEVNNSEVGRIPFQTLATAITNPGVNAGATHDQLIVDDWSAFLVGLGGSAPTLGDEICVSSLIKNSDGVVSANPSNEVCFMPPQRDVYSYTGSDQPVTVPTAANEMFVKAWGAGGGGAMVAFPSTGLLTSKGGSGGYSEALFSSIPSSLIAVVGEAGKTNSDVSTYGGGGKGGVSTGNAPVNNGDKAGSGAGLTGLFDSTINNSFPTFVATDAIIIAGGGGGGGTYGGGSGGAGGGATAQDSDTYDAAGVTAVGATAGSQVAGGLGGGSDIGFPGQDGGLFLGGDGATNSPQSGGGGGSGYYGGGGGSTSRPGGQNLETAGAGGSGFINASGSSSLLLTGADEVPPNTSDLDYAPGIALGGEEEADGMPGHIIIYWIP